MRIIIASTNLPFMEGGGTFIVDWLAKALSQRGFEVEVLKIPFHSHHEHMPSQQLALRLMDLQSAADLLIAIRTPSYLLNHPNKIVWFIHHHRAAYDLWDTEYENLSKLDDGLAYRQFMMATDNKYLREAKKIFTNSKIVGDRLKKFNNIDSTVLYPPLFEPEKFFNQKYGNYVFYPSRFANHKRQMLAVESMKFTQSPVRLIIAGNAEQPYYVEEIKSFIEANNLKNKVTVLNRWISEQEKIHLIANSLAGIYIPFDEDSYGYPTLEFFHSQKPVITCKDSGGTIEIIQNNYNGYICGSNPKSIAKKFDHLFLNKQDAEYLGRNALQTIYQLKITWDHVVESMTKRN